MNDLIVILGDQLWPDLSDLPPNTPVLMREDWLLCTQPKIHKQKIAFFLSAMRHYRDWLTEQDRTVYYQPLEPKDSRSYAQALTDFCQEHTVNQVHHRPILDQPFAQDLQSTLKEADIATQETKSQHFITRRQDWKTYRQETKRLMMADFYIRQRKQHQILLEPDDSPVGGQWSFDTDNRKPFPKSKTPPHVPTHEIDQTTQEVIDLVNQHFPEHPGSTPNFRWPVTRSQALAELDDFLVNRLPNFGPYEDAIAKNHPHLYHSLLTPALNAGLLTPQEVIDRALKHQDQVPLQSLEGFIRQVLGWREFIFQVYLDYQDSPIHLKNHFNHQRRLKDCWYTGETGLPPVDHTIQNLNDQAWVHHIPRLMILGSTMLMSEIHPDEVYRWFMEMFIDSADWVMVPNVYGMSQFADGGHFATKPYISGSSYIKKMTDYLPGDWCDVWDGLYWRFIEKNQEEFSQNPRMSMMVRQLAKLDSDRKQRIFQAAEQFIEQTTENPSSSGNS